MKYNPFKPNSIVHPGMFAGRLDEFKIVEKLFFQTKNGNSSSFIIYGERGIGKSSFLFYIDNVVRGLITPWMDESYGFLSISVSLEPNDDYEEVILKIAREMKREIGKNEKAITLLGSVWEFVTNWEVLGIKYNKEKEKIAANVMLEELCERIIAILKNTRKAYDGVYIFIDEADKPSRNPNLGSLTKNMTERIQKKGVNNFAFGIIGLPIVIEKIKESHESALRLFTSIPLKQLTPEESNLAIDRGLEDGNKKNKEVTSIDDDAKKYIATFSEGYPHFIQQYAYSAFEADKDDHIDTKDVIEGLLGESGALKQLGERYFDRMYFKDIYSKNYRKILGIIAKSTEEYITKQQIIRQCELSESIVTNALNAFYKKGMIIRKKGSKGSYRISTRSFAAWIITLENADRK